MSAQTLYAAAASGGTWANIPATIPAHNVEMVEDGSAAGGAQGLIVQFWNRGTQTWGPSCSYLANQPIEMVGHGHDGVLGYPAQNAANGVNAFNYRAADNYCRVTSATATATTVRVVEQETSPL